MPITKEHLGPILKSVLDNNGIIVDVARNLGVPVLEILPYLKILMDRNETIANLIKEKQWPLDIDIGYIYIGGVPLLSPMGERSGILKPGMHVLAKKLPRKTKSQRYDHYMIYWPKRVIYDKYLKIKALIDKSSNKVISAEYIKDGNGNIKHEWLERDVDHFDYMKQLANTNIILKKTDTIKKTFVPDREIGQVNENMIVNIKYDWT